MGYELVNGMEEREEELLMLDAETHVLFIVGDRDFAAPEVLLRRVRERMRARTWWVRVEGADFELGMGMGVEAEERKEKVCGVLGQIAGRWSEAEEGRDGEKTECTVRWDERRERVAWTDWKALEPLPEKKRGFGDVV